MDVLLGLLAMAGSSVSGLLRLWDTRRAEHTYGVSSLFAWMALVSSCSYVMFALVGDVPYQLLPSLIFCAAFVYVLWRIHCEPRRQWRGLVVFVVVMAAVLAAGSVSADVFGYVAGVLVTVSAVPQVLAVWVSRVPDGVGPWAWLSNFVLALVWAGYGLVVGRVVVWGPNVLAGVLAALVLVGLWRAVRWPRVSARGR